MKSRNPFFVLIVLLLLGLILSLSFTRDREPAQIFPATIVRDCAPWDGAAFTLSFWYDAVTTITISIWKPPNFILPVTFSFPDETMRVGIAYSVKELDPWEELTGEVTFQRVEEGIPVHGRFRLTSERGAVYEGGFAAEWGSQIAYCG